MDVLPVCIVVSYCKVPISGDTVLGGHHMISSIPVTLLLSPLPLIPLGTANMALGNSTVLIRITVNIAPLLTEDHQD